MNTIIDSCKDYIEKNITYNLSVENLAKEFNYSKHHFSRLFKVETGVSIRDYIFEMKMNNAVTDIIQGNKIIDVAIKYGYDTHSGFTKAFKRKFGYSPSLLIAINITEKFINYQGDEIMTYQELFNDIKAKYQNITSDRKISLLEQAYDFAIEAHKGVKRYSGDDYVVHPIYVAHILSEMDAPVEYVILGLIHDCAEGYSKFNLEDIKSNFGETYYKKLIRIKELNVSKDLSNEINLENEEDIILVKLADRLHNMMTLKYMDEARWKEKAEETITIFSPLASKINNNDLKAKLDALTIEYLGSV